MKRVGLCSSRFWLSTQSPYRMLLGDQLTADRYHIESLPDTFLIDRQGRIAASYRATLVDPANVESNVQSLLAQR